MSNKKQIEEMAKVLKDYTKENHIMASHTILENYAEALYNAGYRKQSEGKFVMDDLGNVCTVCGRTYDPQFDIKPRIIKEFKFCPNCGAKMKGGSE